MSTKALYCNNTEEVPAGVASQFLRRNAANNGWEFVAGELLQTAFAEQATNTTQTSATFGDLGTVTLTLTTTAGSALLITFTASASNTNNNHNIDFQLVIDGTAVRGAGMRVPVAGQSDSSAITYKKTGLSAGSHTIKAQWRTDGNTAQIRPTTVLNEHASLLIQEVTV
jgi:hypothetical protein